MRTTHKPTAHTTPFRTLPKKRACAAGLTPEQTEAVFADPVAHLAQFGLESQLTPVSEHQLDQAA